MVYEVEVGHNTAEVTKNISCEKDEGTVDHNTILGEPRRSGKVR